MSSLATLARRLRGLTKPESTARDLRAALIVATTQRDAAVTKMDALNATLGDVLLTDDPGALAKHEAAVQAVDAEVKRADAIIPALRQRIEAAEAREAEAALRAEVDEVERLAAAAVEDVQAYAQAARLVFETTERIAIASRRAELLNKRLRDEGRSDLLVTPPFNRVWPHSHSGVRTVSLRGPRRLNATLREFEADIAEVPRPVVHPVQKDAREEEDEHLRAMGVRRIATIEQVW